MNFTKFVKIGGAALAALTAGLAAAQTPPMRLGKWEVTSKTEMTGMPMQMPAQTSTSTLCVNSENQNRPPINADKSCKVTNYKVVGSGATWSMECTGQGNMKGEGSITFKGDSYTGMTTMNMQMQGASKMTMKSTYAGKWVGAC